MTQKNTEKKGVSPELGAKINNYVGQGLIFACGAGIGAAGAMYYCCGQIEKAAETVHVKEVSKQDLLNMLTGVHSKDDMYNITSKLLYGEVQKTDAMIKENDSPDLLRIARLQKAALRDVQDVIKLRSQNSAENEIAIRQAEIKFQESFAKLQEYTKEQMLRSLGMREADLNQKQIRAGKTGVRLPSAEKSR